MDALDSLQSSSLDAKAERIARYKAERRRMLAERYANLEENTSIYTQRERHQESTDTSNVAPSLETKMLDVSSGLSHHSKESGVLSEQGDRSNSKENTNALSSHDILITHEDQPARSRQQHSPLEAEETQKPQDDGKAEDDIKTDMTSHLKGLEKADILATPKNQAEEISEKGTDFTSYSSSDKSEENAKERKNFKQDEKISHFQSFTAGQEDASNKDVGNARDQMAKENDQKAREKHFVHMEDSSIFPGVLNVDKEPTAATPLLQRQDSGQRSIKGILKKSRSTSLDLEPGEQERTTICKELTVVDGNEEKK